MCLVVAKNASGPKSNSCTFNSNLIRALNCFSAQPFSALTVSLSLNTLSQFLSPSLSFSISALPAFYLYNYRSPFYLSTFLSLSLSLSYHNYTVSNTAVHLTSFLLPNLSTSCPCHFIWLTLSFPLTPFFSLSLQFYPEHFHLSFFFSHHHLRFSGFVFILISQNGGCSPHSFPHSPH